MSDLLKFARARDDQNLIWRISAAMMVRAQETEFWDLDTNSRQLVNWVLDNPMVSLPDMVNHVTTNTSIAANVNVDGGIIDTSGVPDADIQFVVNDKWQRVADGAFNAKRMPSAQQTTTIPNRMG